MLVPNQLIEVRVSTKTFKHYKSLGYDVKCLDTIMVPPQHLTEGSSCNVKLNCDICNKEMTRPYKQYLLYHRYGYDTCNQCKDKKAKQTCVDKYGVETHMLVPEVQKKVLDTMRNIYDVDNISQLNDIKEKKKKTCQKNFGVENPMFSNEIQKKLETTMLQKYGCKNAKQNEQIKERAVITNIKKYGVQNPMQNVKIKAKAMETMVKNSVIPTSKQQLEIYKIIKQRYPEAELNYPFSTCSLDIFICVNGINIDIEYEGCYWHRDSQRDIKRDKFLQSQGFKTLRIKSGHLLPTEEELFDAINYLVNTEHHFKEIILSDWKEGDLCHAQLQVVV